MCGIFGYVGGRNNAASLVFGGLTSLEYRGYDSWGVSLVHENKIYVKKRSGKIGNNNVDVLPTGKIAIGHTRWATHGEATDKNAHPHLDCLSNISIIHNGIFENYENIKKGLEGKGHKFTSETDSEVIAHSLEEIISPTGLSNDTFLSVFNNMAGLNAVVAIDNRGEKIFAARNGSPLVVGVGKNENFIASDVSALIPHTNKVYFLDDNQMAVITKDNIEIFDTKNKNIINPKYETLNWNVSQTHLGDFPNFMLKEIYEQPKIINEISLNSSTQIAQFSKVADKYKNIYLVGCGSAYFAALSGQYLFSKIAGKQLFAIVASEFAYHIDFINEKSLILFISQSGETMDVLEFAKKAKQKNAKIACLTNVFGSSLYRMSDFKMLIGAGPELAVASTKALTGMVSHLLLLAHGLKDIKTGQKTLTTTAKAVGQLLRPKNVKEIQSLAANLQDKRDIFVIGRGLSYPTALETALKIKEISYIHAEGLATGELKHGTIALIEKGTPCILFLPNDETYQESLNGAMELKARGATIIGISNKPNTIFDLFIKIDEAGNGTLLVNIVFAQLLAYFLTIAKKLDPDKPRNLAKSVTVK